MNEVLRRRLVGLAVLLFGLFLLSWFVPGGDGRGVEPGTPSALVPLGPGGVIEAPVTNATDKGSPPGETPAPALAAEPSAPPIADLTTDAKPAAESPKPEPLKPAPPAAAAAAPFAKPALKLAQTVTPEHAAEARKPVAAPAARTAAAKPEPARTTPPAKPAPAAKPAASAAGWWIQIGSYSDRGKAETILSLLRKVGHHGELTTIKGHKGLLNRVRLGPYANEAAARTALPKVAHQGYPQARVVSEPPAH